MSWRDRLAARFLFLLFAGALLISAPEAAAAPPDPVVTDPAAVDPDYPPSMRELSFDSHGRTLSGLIYLANGAGPHPAVVLMHGFPGNEKNLDVAQALRRAGWNVLFFHYRGAWGSEGAFSLRNSMGDVPVAVAYLRANAARLRTDPARIALVGHSLGGFVALWGGSRIADIACTIALSPVDFGAAGLAMRRAAEASGEPAKIPDTEGLEENLDQGQELVMLEDYDLPALFAEMTGDAEALSVASFAAGHAGKKLLLVAGARDRVVPPPVHLSLVRLFSGVPGLMLEERVLDADHAYSWRRIELARLVTGWLDANCR